MSDMPICPKCDSEYTYNDGNMFICSTCAHEWNESSDNDNVDAGDIVRDANGNSLSDGDTVVLIKDLKLKGFAKDLKQGTVVKNITLTSVAGHNISCKISGFGDMYLKSEFVKKA